MKKKKWEHRVIAAIIIAILVWGAIGLAFGPTRYTPSGEDGCSDSYGRC